jgi:hypothetical protein
MSKKLERINSFIKMYGMQEVVCVLDVFGDGPYQVEHKAGKDEYNYYVCKTLDAAGDCVNRIIFDLPINATPADSTI